MQKAIVTLMVLALVMIFPGCRAEEEGRGARISLRDFELQMEGLQDWEIADGLMALCELTSGIIGSNKQEFEAHDEWYLADHKYSRDMKVFGHQATVSATFSEDKVDFIVYSFADMERLPAIAFAAMDEIADEKASIFIRTEIAEGGYWFKSTGAEKIVDRDGWAGVLAESMKSDTNLEYTMSWNYTDSEDETFSIMHSFAYVNISGLELKTCVFSVR